MSWNSFVTEGKQFIWLWLNINSSLSQKKKKTYIVNKSLLGKKLHLMGFNFSDLNKSIVSAVICVSEAARSGGRKSPEMRHAADAAKRRRFSTSWPTNCLYHTALAPTWTKPPSWGWPSASCAHASCSPHVRTHSYYGENWWQRSWGERKGCWLLLVLQGNIFGMFLHFWVCAAHYPVQ